MINYAIKSVIGLIMCVAWCNSSLTAQLWIDLAQEGKALPEIKTAVVNFRNTLDDAAKIKSLDKHFNRWLFKNADYYNANGVFSNDARQAMQLARTFAREKSSGRSTFGEWAIVSPPISEDFESGTPNQGVVYDIEFDPNDSNIIYAGTQGGLWRKNGANPWEHLTFGLPIFGVSGVVIVNSQTIYFLSGADDEFFRGIYKSTDGGYTWDLITWLNNSSTNVKTYGLFCHPHDAQIQFAIAGNGIYRTEDGWVSYDHVIVGHPIFDLEFHPTRPDTIYACSKSFLLRSTNNGISGSWFNILDPDEMGSNAWRRSSIALCPLDPDMVFVAFGKWETQQLFLSRNAGDTFVLRDAGTDGVNTGSTYPRDSISGGQAQWNFELAVNPTDSNDVFIGAQHVYRSTAGGATGTWTSISDVVGSPRGAIHDDMQDLEWQGNVLFAGTDGGISYNSDYTIPGWNSSLSQGLIIGRAERLDAQGDALLAGFWHAGCNFWQIGDTHSGNLATGDGFEVFFDPDDPDDRIMTGQGPGFWINTTQFIVGPDACEPWGAPFFPNPANPDQYYYTCDRVWTFSKSSGNYTDIGLGVTGKIRGLSFCQNQPTKGYFTALGTGGQNMIKYFENPGGVVIDRSDSIPDSIHVGDVLVDANNPAKVWLLNLNRSGPPILYSSDTAKSWVDSISGNLPPMRAHAIARIPSNNQIYLATDYGVYYKNDNLADWIRFSNGLGYVHCNDLDIDNGYLYVAIRGAGVWRSPLYEICPEVIVLTDANDPNPGSPGYQRHEASDFVWANREINGQVGTDVTISGGNFVRLLSGFEAKTLPSIHATMPSKVEILSSGCTENSP